MIDAPGLPPHRRFSDLAAALIGTIPRDARVVGFGELHARSDRPAVRSSLAGFGEALPRLGDRISDLILETWVIDRSCGQAAVTATKRIEAEVRRPPTIKSEIARLLDAARGAGIQPHAMTLSCRDYERLAPTNRQPDPVAMLDLVTRELTRITASAIAYRDRQASRQRPWIALYGGALHNDRFPDPGVAEWSYAGAVDRAARGRFVEVDIIVPELADADPESTRAAWYPLTRDAQEVRVWQRGERSFVVILPRGPATGGAAPPP